MSTTSEYLVRPSTFALLLLTISRSSFLSQLPFPHLHNSLTLLTAFLTLQSTQTPPSCLHALFLFSLSLLLQHLPTLHPDISTHAILHKRLLWAASLGALQHLFAVCLVSTLWAVILAAALGRLLALYIAEYGRAGYAPEDVQASPLITWLNQLTNGEMPAYATILIRDMPFALASAATAAVMEGGYASMVVRPGGRVVHSVSVTDIVSYGLANGAGLALAKVLIPALWNAPGQRTIEAALRESLDAAAWVLYTVASHVYVAVAVAERDVLGFGCTVLNAVFVVVAVRLVLALVDAADRIVREHRPDRRWAVGAVRVLVAACFAHIGYDRFCEAIAAEAEKNVTF